MEEITLHPEWRQAVQDMLAEGFKDGDILTHEWLESHFGMSAIAADEALTQAQFQERQFAWLQNIESFRAELLEKHQIHLASVYGEGYRITPAREQTAIAQERFDREATKAYRRAAETLKHVRLDQLSESERKENSDAIAKLAMLRGMQKAIE
ncbi:MULTISPECIES: hypothetical protein [Pandoraea]|uniref:hypothetical protein n=1 Tax=Pandoraea TaxID=93217 RepID=UPI0003D1F3DB|nr:MULTISPECIES: hypothetical protein [Pandoraea]AHB77599.1 hypothetical protein X636_20810 [Pandoraea pnomenusa]